MVQGEYSVIKLIKPYITFDEVEKDFRDIFESGWFTKGKFVDEFKEELKKYTGAGYAHLATSATTALTACLKVINIQPGDEVIVSDFSFPATVNVVEDLGAIPIFADVSRVTFNMTAEELISKITPKTKAVIFVDALGNPSGLHEIKEICKKNKIVLIEDAACGIGSSEFGVKCGAIADLTCFSFHPRKLLTTGEGGAITTNNEEYSRILDIKLNHGSVMRDGKFDFIDVGYNYRLPELQAVMGIKQLRKLSDIVSSRNLIRNELARRLEAKGFFCQASSKDVVHNIQSLVFVVPENLNRDKLVSDLKLRGIESTLGTYCLSNCTYYREKYHSVQPNALFLEKNTITLPCYEGLDVDKVAGEVLKGL